MRTIRSPASLGLNETPVLTGDGLAKVLQLQLQLQGTPQAEEAAGDGLSQQANCQQANCQQANCQQTNCQQAQHQQLS